MSNDTQQPPIGNVPTARARSLVRDMIAEAQVSDDPTRYWETLLALASSAMAAHVSHDAVIKAHAGLLEIAQLHRGMQSTTNH